MLNSCEILSKEAVQFFLDKSFSKETSLDNGLWTPEKPHFGHCATATLVAQDYRGGIVREIFIPREYINQAGACVHYVLVLDGEVEDYTKEQFPSGFPHEFLIERGLFQNSGLEDMREKVLSFQEVSWRYQLLKGNFMRQFELHQIAV